MKSVDYESEKILSEYLHFHYGSEREINPRGGLPSDYYDYARRIIKERFLGDATPGTDLRGLDVGCAVGASAFEMARHCREVVALDYSQAFIQAATELQNKGELTYDFYLEGIIKQRFTARVDPEIERERVTFSTGDAHDLPSHIGSFDWVLGANLLCRLHTPDRFLAQLPALVKPGGILVLNSTFTWMATHTPEENWIGGGRDGIRCAAALHDRLKSDFTLVDQTEMPLLLRETARKYQLTFAHSSKWVRV